MNLDRLHQILGECTVQLRKGEAVTGRQIGPLEVVEVFAMPHVDEVQGLESVDCHFLVIGVDKAKAELHRNGLVEILKTYPNPERLAGGPSYIEVGGVLGDQGAAFQLFALGKVLKLWDIITPETMHFKGAEADEMAGRGFIMCTGFRGGGTA